jgi:hypothetical protein
MPDGDYRRVVACCAQFIFRKNAEAAAGDADSFAEANMQVVQFDVAVESGLQRLDDTPLQNWACPGEDDLRNDK